MTETIKSSLLLYGGAGLTAFVLTLIAIRLCKRLAFRTGMLDVPKSEGHKQHRSATPLLGGLAMASGWTLTILAGVSLFGSRLNLATTGRELLVIVLCAAGAMVIGLIDDRRAMSAKHKFLLQLAVSLIAVLFGGLRISLFVPNEIFSCIITVCWFLFIFNAVNFFDNMDGLAVGMAAIAFAMFLLVSIINVQYFVAALCACSLGAAAAFWIVNARPASMFMGDAGSHFLAFLLAVVSVKVSYYHPAVASTHFAVLIPLFILAVPIFDAFAVVAIRLRNHKPIYVGDNNHISHRFLHMGFSRGKAVLMVHLLCLTIGLGALPILWGDWKTCIILFIEGLVFLTVLSLIQTVSNEVKHEKE